jgi:hypothetical protein
VFRSFEGLTPKRPYSFAAAVALIASVLLTCGATTVSAQHVPSALEVMPGVIAPADTGPRPLVVEDAFTKP